MKLMSLRWSAMLLMVCVTALTQAQVNVGNPPLTPARQDIASIRALVEQYLQTQGADLPGQVEVKVGTVDSRLNVPACMNLEAFLPNGSRAWGKTTVGVRCSAPSPWVIYVSSTVSVWTDYVVAATPLAQNQQINKNDVAMVRGDLAILPAGTITDPALAIGHTTAISLAIGAPLRRDTLRIQAAVQQGQLVRLVTSGPGFKVSTEARAISNAGEGQLAQTRTPGGQLISGIARSGGIVEVAY